MGYIRGHSKVQLHNLRLAFRCGCDYEAASCELTTGTTGTEKEIISLSRHRSEKSDASK